MTQSQAFRTLVLVSAGVAALSLAACKKDGASQNGAYVETATDSSAPATSQALPPSNEYQAVADTPPPPLPVYDQPPIPGSGYVWTPGYWDWSNGDADYYWVPGTWVEPPSDGYLWTPGYWRFYNGRYLFSDGYWGPQVGFYGGVDYGYGYGGNGYNGGRWQGNQFYYNSQANNLGDRRIGATYSEGLSSNGDRASFNGGPGGVRAAPAPADLAAAHARAAPPTAGQREQARAASAQPQLRASVNRGSPPIAATSRPGAFHSAAGVTATRSAAVYTPPTNRTAAPEAARPGASSFGRPDEQANRPIPPAAGRPMGADGRSAPAQTARLAHETSAPTRAIAQERAGPMRMAGPERTPQVRAAGPERAAQERAAPERAPPMRAAPAERAAPIERTPPVRAQAAAPHAAPAAADARPDKPR